VSVLAVVACKSAETPPKQQPAPAPAKPADDMDERMRHCPLALDGASTTVEDIPSGVRFTIVTPPAQVGEVQTRAHHIVEFAARKTREGHGGADAKGGGRMRNCPVVTDDVVIVATDTPTGATLDVTATAVDVLRAETRTRAAKFPFTGATVNVR